MQWPERPTCHEASISPVFRVSAFELRWRDPEPHRHPAGTPFRTCSYCGSIHPEDLVAVLEAGACLGGSDWKYSWPHKFYLHDVPNPLAGQQVRCGYKPIDWGKDRDTPESELGVFLRRNYLGRKALDGLIEAILDSSLTPVGIGDDLAAVLRVIHGADPASDLQQRTADRLLFWANREKDVESRDRTSPSADPTIQEASVHTHGKWYNEHLQDKGFDDEARTKLFSIVSEYGGIHWELEDGKLKYRAPHGGYQKPSRSYAEQLAADEARRAGRQAETPD